MQIENTLVDFKKHLIARQIEVESLTLDSGIAALLSFYRGERVEGCLFERDADMLLYQWGTYDWGEGENFNWNLTRQLILSDEEDDDIWQLSLTFKFAPTDNLRTLGSGNKWCQNLQQADNFEKYIRQSEEFQILSEKQPRLIELNYFNAG